MQGHFREAFVHMPGEAFEMAPDPLGGIRVNELRLAVHELPGMADGEAIGDVGIPPVFIGEHDSVGIAPAENDGRERDPASVLDAAKHALPCHARDAAEHPLLAHDGLIPLRSAGKILRDERLHEIPEDSVHPPCGFGIDAERTRDIRAGTAGTHAEEIHGLLPLRIREAASRACRPCPAREGLAAVRTLETLPVMGIFSESSGSSCPTEPTEYPVHEKVEEER